MTDFENEIEPIAVIGLSVRVPGAATPDEYWRNICDKREALSRFSAAELSAAGVPRGLLDNPAYVRAACVLNDADHFDPEAFGISRSESAILDPQHRLFLECAWEALESAGHDPKRFDGAIGVYGGCFMNRYLLNLYTNEKFIRSPMAYFARNYNDKDFLTGHAAYLLNLRGPAVTIQTACSTSLVATHMACQALHGHDCDLALAGGVSVTVPLKAGYLAMEGTMYSPDGQCRPFDASARGTIPGSGGVMLALRRLSDARASGDNIIALIRGTAINNDGRNKVSFTAPNPDGQVQVIVSAHTVAGVHPDSIGYVETHGTGTQVGDPIEISALTDAFRVHTQRTGYCALGSVKANIGHLDAAAGAAGLARAALALQHKLIPPQTNFSEANPELRLSASPFFVPTEARQWSSADTPRRAAVSSFAVGGTNAHAVLEEAPTPQPRTALPRRPYVFVLSAQDETALNAQAERLADHLERAPEQPLLDVAHTLAVGRQELQARRTLVARDHAALTRALREPAEVSVLRQAEAQQVVFMFPGVGTQTPDMGLEIYDREPVFRQHVDHCATLLQGLLDLDIRAYLFESRNPDVQVDRESVPHALAAIFTLEYALGQLWLSWGIKPSALLGHSLGEYVAACMAGVLSLPDALDLTVKRGRIFDHIPEGRMMGVPLSEQELVPLLGERLSLGAVNAPELCLASGQSADLVALRDRLAERDWQCRILPVRMASHSSLVDPYLAGFERTVSTYTLSAPTIPYLSCKTGTWISADQATSAKYWAEQLRSPVQFRKMVCEVLSTPGRVLLEVGPGHTLTSLAAAQRLSPRPLVIPSLRHAREVERSDLDCLMAAVGKLWQAGVRPDWQVALGPEAARRTALPTYAFQRKRYWISQERPIGPGSWTDDVVPVPVEPNTEAVASANTVEKREHLPDGNERERAIAAIWREHLGCDRVGLDDDFEALGGHSLLAAQLLPDLNRLTTSALKVKDLFGAPTIRKLAALVEARTASPGEVTQVDLTQEVVLADDVNVHGLAALAPAQPSQVLLTGGTGFLGTFLLAELLQGTSATVYCLVRARDAADGELRLLQALDKFKLPRPAPGRLIAVPGDLKEPRLGMSQTDFDWLATEVDAIYHCGAWVNFARPYPVLKTANVGGTVEVLRLATQRRLKAVHYVSTLFVTMGSITTGVPLIREDDPLPPPINHDTSYTESKWVAESICRLALARGVPVAIYRPGNILGARGSGVTNPEDFFTKSIQGCVQLGLAPRRTWSLPFGTVDDVARMIVRLSVRTDCIGRTYHLVHPQQLEWNTLFEQVRLAGYGLPFVPWAQWREAFFRQLAERTDNALAPLANEIREAPADRIWSQFAVENVATAREEMREPYPFLDREYYASVFRYMASVGLLPRLNEAVESAAQ